MVDLFARSLVAGKNVGFPTVRDSAVASLGLSVQWLPSFNTYLNLTLQMGRSGYDSQQINAGVNFSF